MSRPGILAILWLILQPVVFHWRPLISRTAYLPYDLPGYHTPVASVVVEALSQGRLPLWDPYIYAGYPIHADITAQILYPPAWPVFLKSLVRNHTVFYWLEWEVVLHISLAGALTWWLLRRANVDVFSALFGATVYQLGCFFSTQVQHLGAVCGAAWMPLAWLAVIELAAGFSVRWCAALAVSLAMSLLAGFPAVTLIVYGSTLLVAIAWWISGKARAMILVYTVAGIVISLALAAGQLIPSALWSEHSAAGLRWSWAQGGGLPRKALLSALSPNWFLALTPERFTEPYNFTFMCLYNGQAALWLCLAAVFIRAARVFAVLTAIFAALMCGVSMPGYRFLFDLLPATIRGAAYIEFTTCAFSLAMALAAAFALCHLTRGRPWIAGLVALATSIELTAWLANRQMNSSPGDWRVGVDSHQKYFERDDLLPKIRHWLHATTPPTRMDTTQYEYRFVTVAPAVRLPTLGGDNPMAPRRMLQYRKLFSSGNAWERFYPISDPTSPLIGAAGVGYILHAGGDLEQERRKLKGWRQVDWDLAYPVHLFRNQQPSPRYYLVPRVRRAKSAAEALEYLKSSDPRQEAVVEGGIPPLISTGHLPAVQVLSYRPEKVDLKTTAGTGSFLMIAESWASDWEARVDGRPARLHPTNVAFLGLPLDAGEHRITVEYVPRAAYAAAAGSALAWLVLGVWVWRARRPMIQSST